MGSRIRGLLGGSGGQHEVLRVTLAVTRGGELTLVTGVSIYAGRCSIVWAGLPLHFLLPKIDWSDWLGGASADVSLHLPKLPFLRVFLGLHLAPNGGRNRYVHTHNYLRITTLTHTHNCAPNTHTNIGVCPPPVHTYINTHTNLHTEAHAYILHAHACIHTYMYTHMFVHMP